MAATPSPYYYCAKLSPAAASVRMQASPRSTPAATGRPRSAPGTPAVHVYASPKPPPGPSNPFGDMGIDPLKMYMQHFGLRDTPENRRIAWEVVSKVAQRILDRDEAEEKARQPTVAEDDDDDDEKEYEEFLAFKERRRQRRRSARASEQAPGTKTPGSRTPDHSSYPSPSQTPHAHPTSAGYSQWWIPPGQGPQAYYHHPAPTDSMLFNSGPVPGPYAAPPAPRTHHYFPANQPQPYPTAYPKTPASAYQMPLAPTPTGTAPKTPAVAPSQG
ncbi:hypothetical protein FRB90_009619 [Tulasnella sp. 427]|nr:hypothetical protein FRB90_009619 [Tulasnella sp. 427]